jgi:tRNA threonylcarbamoyladenosine biosynthesis protein TsaB
MTERIVLALDLSSPRGLLAVVCGKEVLFEAQFQSERSHNAQLFAPLTEALEIIGERPAVMVVGTGPGSYTGVRISIAAAQGVGLARGWPVMGWPSIATLPFPEYQVLGDARRGHFYRATVRNGRLVAAPEVITADEATAAEASGGKWVTMDAKVPLGLAEVSLAEPQMETLARYVIGLTEAEIAAAAGQLLEPVYLQEAFITIAQKAGKGVPLNT